MAVTVALSAFGSTPAAFAAPQPPTGGVASRADVAGCRADHSAVRRDPYGALFYAKRGQVWYATQNQTTGPAGLCFIFGNPGDIGLVADWGAGRPTPAVFRPSTGEWFLGATEFGSSVREVRRLGRPGDYPVTGDWDGDGDTDIGVVRGSTWLLQTDPSSGTFQGTRVFGLPTDRPVDIRVGLGSRLAMALYRPSTSTFLVGGDTPELQVEQFGSPGDLPMTWFSTWRRSPYSEGGAAVFRPSTATVHLQTRGPIPDVDRAFAFGNRTDHLLVAPPVCHHGRFVPQPCNYS